MYKHACCELKQLHLYMYIVYNDDVKYNTPVILLDMMILQLSEEQVLVNDWKFKHTKGRVSDKEVNRLSKNSVP